MNAPVLAAGLADPVRDSQAIFRAVMDAMARPGSVHEISFRMDVPMALPPTSAAIALALCDFETTVWLSPALEADEAVAAFLRFHTGARLTPDPSTASFAFLAAGDVLPPLDDFAQGTAEYPDRSTTLVIPVQHLAEGDGWTLIGPGIDGERRLSAGPLPADMPERLAANRALFPRGVDLVFVAGSQVAALPRSTLVQA